METVEWIQYHLDSKSPKDIMDACCIAVSVKGGLDKQFRDKMLDAYLELIPVTQRILHPDIYERLKNHRALEGDILETLWSKSVEVYFLNPLLEKQGYQCLSR